MTCAAATTSRATKPMPGRTMRASDRGIEIRFEHDRRIVNAVRKIPGRKFDWQSRVWIAPMSSLPEAVDLLERERFDIPTDLYDRLPAILDERQKRNEASKQRKQEREAAAARLQQHDGPIAFVPAGDVLLTRRLKAHGIYHVQREETTVGDQHVKQTIGYDVPDNLLISTLAELDRPTDPVSRLTETLRVLFTVDREAKRLRPDYASAAYRNGKRARLIAEACRLAMMQDVFTWGWQRNTSAQSDRTDWIVYFEHDGEQVRFAHHKRLNGPDFPGEWNQQRPAAFPWPQMESERTQ